jgi:hypothetical protein
MPRSKRWQKRATVKRIKISTQEVQPVSRAGLGRGGFGGFGGSMDILG